MNISILFFIVAICVFRKSKFSIAHVFIFVGLILVTIALGLLYWVSNYFTGSGITDATIYHIRYGLGGSGFGQYKDLIIKAIIFIIGTSVFLWWIILKAYHNKNGKIFYAYLAIFFISVALFFNPAISDLYRIYSISKGQGDISISGNLDFYNFYKEPTIKQIGEKKNLVFIYAESLEQAYSNEKAFPKLTEGLNSLAKKSIFFTKLKQTQGAGYTIAGMVASQCGIPLIGPAYGNSMSGMDTYLPTASCLGDLLKKEGYHLAYYGGANLAFAGKGLFLKTHGFDETLGLQELLPMLESSSYKNAWGLYDDSLFDLSYIRFLELSQSQNPFAFFMLTLDTHQSDDNLSKSCNKMQYNNASNPMLNAVACSDYLITEFVNKILTSPYAVDTVVVVASDHFYMHSNPAKNLSSNTERSNRLMIIPPNVFVPTEIIKSGSTLDIGTTVLPFIGYAGEIGLGRNLLNPQQVGAEIEIIQTNIPRWMKQLSNFWNFPKINDTVQIDTLEKTIIIDGRKFKIPVLVELNSDLQTTLKFQFDLEFDKSKQKNERDLISLTKKLDKNTPFLLINFCEEINKIAESNNKTGFCLLSGKGTEYSIVPLIDTRILTLEDILYLTGLSVTR